MFICRVQQCLLEAALNCCIGQSLDFCFLTPLSLSNSLPSQCNHLNQSYCNTIELLSHREVFLAIGVLLEMEIPHNMAVIWGQSLHSSSAVQCVRVVVFPRQPITGELHKRATCYRLPWLYRSQGRVRLFLVYATVAHCVAHTSYTGVKDVFKSGSSPLCFAAALELAGFIPVLGGFALASLCFVLMWLL